MAGNPFAAILDEELVAQDSNPESLRILQEFCEGIGLSTAGRAVCSLERGHKVSYGQEWRPVLRASMGGPPHLLFRAYVPSDAWPVMLDLHQGALTSVDRPEEMSQELQDFLRDPNVVAQIKYVMSFPSPPPAPTGG